MYSGLPPQISTIEDPEQLAPLLLILVNRAPGQLERNTLLMETIQCYHRKDISPIIQGLVNFVLLQGARNSGIMVITLIDQALIEYDCPILELVAVTGQVSKENLGSIYKHCGTMDETTYRRRLGNKKALVLR